MLHDYARRTTRWALVCALLLGTLSGYGQTTTLSGVVKDGSTGEPLAGVSVSVVGTVFGTITDKSGSFSLSVNVGPNTKLRFTYIGFTSQTVDVGDQNSFDITLEEIGVAADEVVVSASRVSERVFDAPVTIEKMDILAVQNTASVSYYQGLQNLKGVDYATSSINFQILNTRGFNSTGNTQFVQLIDGMDAQAPTLNFPIGSLNGPSELDIESVELIPGASSALYGSQAFNGAILMTSKSPFLYQGLSAFVKVGVNHVDNQDRDAAPLYDVSLRYAKAFAQDRLAFKLTLSYSQAQDWQGQDFSDRNPERQGGLSFNPGYDGVHLLGDEAALGLQVLGGSTDFINSLAAAVFGGSTATAQAYANAFFPSAGTVARTGYDEETLVDYEAKNFKIGGSFHWRITDKIEAIAAYNGGYGTTVYTGLGRYSLRNFAIHQGKLELKGDNFFLRGYITKENDGDSYIADFLANGINNAWLSNEDWFGNYGVGYIIGIASQGLTPGNTPTAAQREIAHNVARNGNGVTFLGADALRVDAGTARFTELADSLKNVFIPNGSSFDVASGITHIEGQYNFKNQITFAEVIAGASYRTYNLQSDGTVFDDADREIDFYELGAYVQVTKDLLEGNLKLGGSLRYDEQENFDGVINPRVSALVKVSENHNFRASYQTGFRFPTTQGQYINLDLVSFQLVGGIQEFNDEFIERFDRAIPELGVSAGQAAFAYDLASAQTALATGSINGLISYVHRPVQPEKVQNFEVGYKGIIAENLFVDLGYYYNTFTDFIIQTRVILSPFAIASPAQLGVFGLSDSRNTRQIYTNSTEELSAHGFAAGFDYRIGKFNASVNYNYNDLLDEIGSESDIVGFNTPEHKTNVSFGGRKIADNWGFNVTWRWQDAYFWESSFANATVPSFNTVDAQVSYKIPNIKTVVKFGGQNLLNHRYVTNAGGPLLGAIYYISFTFDEFAN